MEDDSWKRDHVGRIMGEESGRRNHQGGTLRRNRGGGTMEEETWRRKHGRGNMENESRNMNHGGGIMGEESCRRIIDGGIMGNLGSVWEASGTHLGSTRGSIWEAFLEGEAAEAAKSSRRHLEGIWGASGTLRPLLEPLHCTIGREHVNIKR